MHDLLKGREYNRNKAMEGFDEVNDPRIACAVYADVLLRPMVGILRCGKMLPPQLNLVIEIEFADATTALWSENAGAHPSGATLSTDFEIQNVRVLGCRRSALTATARRRSGNPRSPRVWRAASARGLWRSACAVRSCRR